jgi:CDP-diacylglycerol--glycerol-3-phosphate 3-phosphatidyltransferase
VGRPIERGLGLANWLSVIRGALIALLFGFVAAPWPEGWRAWLPGILYVTASLMDFADGYAARRMQRESVLGEKLDMNLDGMGILAASLVAIGYGQVPAGYLMVGLARYGFLLGGWLLRRKEIPLRSLRPNPFRRALAGAQMGFIAVVLLPVFFPPVTWVAALFFAAPFVVNFFIDWLWVSGQLSEKLGGELWSFPNLTGLKRKLPLFFRGLLAIVLVSSLFAASVAGWMRVVLSVALISISLGLAGRSMALVLVLLSGFLLQQMPLSRLFWIQLVLSTAVFFSGTGTFSIWAPEDGLIYQRAGGESKP